VRRVKQTVIVDTFSSISNSSQLIILIQIRIDSGQMDILLYVCLYLYIYLFMLTLNVVFALTMVKNMTQIK